MEEVSSNIRSINNTLEVCTCMYYYILLVKYNLYANVSAAQLYLVYCIIISF